MCNYLPDNPKAYDFSGYSNKNLITKWRYNNSHDWYERYESGNQYDRAEMSAQKDSVQLELKKRASKGQ